MPQDWGEQHDEFNKAPSDDEIKRGLGSIKQATACTWREKRFLLSLCSTDPKKNNIQLAQPSFPPMKIESSQHDIIDTL
jgi:hypothetical protein